jgi:hypothetical protein
MGKVKGNDLVIYADGVAVAASRSCDVDIVCEAVPVAGSGGARDFIPGRKSWAVAVSCLIATDAAVLEPGRRVRLTVGVRKGERLTEDRLTGEAIVLSRRTQGTRMTLAVVELNLQGCGELKKLTASLLDIRGKALLDKSGKVMKVLER